MKIILFVFTALFIMEGCNKKKNISVPNHTADKSELMEADKAFSKMSEEKGMKNAFIEFIDSNGVLLRPEHMPIVGANAIDYLVQQNDTSYSLTWQPQYAEVALSGDLGYTYGIYILRPKSKDTTIYGTYSNIWKKQKDGKWKFVLDTGNEGIGEQSFQ